MEKGGWTERKSMPTKGKVVSEGESTGGGGGGGGERKCQETGRSRGGLQGDVV
jgi:hypothetical protein